MKFVAGEDTGGRPLTPGPGGDTAIDEGESVRSPTPGPGSDPPTRTKRKSGIFWRRTSSVGLATAFGANGSTGAGPNGATNRAVNGNQNEVNGDSENVKMGGMGGQENEKPSPTLDQVPTRSYSPPPQLPEFVVVGAEAGLGGDDLFKDIH